MKLSFTLLTFFFVVSACVLLSASAYELEKSPSTSSFEKVKRMMLVKAQIDTREGYFLIDTGADDLVLNQQHFRNYATIENLGNYRDVNGRKRKVDYIRIGSFRWANLVRSDFYVQQLDFSAVENVLEREVLGLIGFEVFRNFELAIDYDKQEIVVLGIDPDGKSVEPVYETSPAYSLSFLLSDHLPTLEADFGGDQTVRIGLDSGSTINILDRKWKKSLAAAAHRRNKINFLGANASRKRRAYFTVDQLDIQNKFAIRFWKAAIGKLDHFEDREIFLDGIMGINFFEIGRVSINYQQQQISVWPNDNALRWRYVSLNENLVRKNGDAPMPGTSNER